MAREMPSRPISRSSQSLSSRLPDAVARQAFEPDLLDDLREAQEPGLHVRRQGPDLRVNDGVESLKGPAHPTILSQKRDWPSRSRDDCLRFATRQSPAR